MDSGGNFQFFSKYIMEKMAETDSSIIQIVVSNTPQGNRKYIEVKDK